MCSMRDGYIRPYRRVLFGGVENRRRGAVKFRDRRNAFRAIDQTGTSQQRREITDLAMMVEDLVVQRREEFAEAHVLLRRNLLQGVPARHFQADRRAMATYPQRSGLGLVVALRLMREQMAHGFLRSDYNFAKRYTGPSDLTMPHGDGPNPRSACGHRAEHQHLQYDRQSIPRGFGIHPMHLPSRRPTMRGRPDSPRNKNPCPSASCQNRSSTVSPPARWSNVPRAWSRNWWRTRSTLAPAGSTFS